MTLILSSYAISGSGQRPYDLHGVRSVSSHIISLDLSNVRMPFSSYVSHPSLTLPIALHRRICKGERCRHALASCTH